MSQCNDRAFSLFQCFLLHIELLYFNDQEIWATVDSELLVNDAVLLGQPVDAVVALPHPTKQKYMINTHEKELFHTTDLRMAPQMA